MEARNGPRWNELFEHAAHEPHSDGFLRCFHQTMRILVRTHIADHVAFPLALSTGWTLESITARSGQLTALVAGDKLLVPAGDRVAGRAERVEGYLIPWVRYVGAQPNLRAEEVRGHCERVAEEIATFVWEIHQLFVDELEANPTAAYPQRHTAYLAKHPGDDEDAALRKFQKDRWRDFVWVVSRALVGGDHGKGAPTDARTSTEPTAPSDCLACRVLGHHRRGWLARYLNDHGLRRP